MTTSKITELLNAMACKVRLLEIFKDQYKGNVRECPFKSELVGMEETLKILGIDFEYEFNNVYEITAITAQGIKVEI